jgi:ribonucleoside-diphosphate reductase beta chain
MIPSRNFYKPLDFPWAHDLWRKHEAMHWMVHEVSLHEDVKDWNEKLSDSEKNLLTHLFRFFTQADVDVAAGYTQKFLPYFGGTPELAMMMSSFAARESIHIDAYAVLLETVGMPETTYQQFHEYKAMKDKHDFVEQFGMDTDENVLKSLAVYSAFTEGMQLFASFVVLLNFARFNKMKNMGNIISWSIRDEDLHVEGMTTLFRECVNTPLGAEISDLEVTVKAAAMKMVELEDSFIDLIFSDTGAVEGLTPEEVKSYIRFISNKRWSQLGFTGKLFDIERNPLPWVDHMVNGEEHANFFERRATEYSKAMTKGTMEDIEW